MQYWVDRPVSDQFGISLGLTSSLACKHGFGKKTFECCRFFLFFFPFSFGFTGKLLLFQLHMGKGRIHPLSSLQGLSEVLVGFVTVLKGTSAMPHNTFNVLSGGLSPEPSASQPLRNRAAASLLRGILNC